jgi:hypothetical protein
VFAQRQLRYLGHVISEHGVAADLAKVEAVLNWPPLVSLKELQSFLGLASYYRLFVWTNSHHQSFEAVKQAITSAPVLVLPEFSQPFVPKTDSSGSGVGAILM